MITEDLKERLQAEPFVPFVVRASSGQAYRVASPGLVVMMKSAMFIAAPKADKWTILPYFHVAGLEGAANGHGPRRSKSGR